MIVGVRSALFQEDHMVRKVEMLAAKAGAVEGDSAIEREGLKLAQDMPLKEQVIFTGSTDWSPDQAEHYIDWRIQCIDSDIARLRQQLDDLISSRKRWLAVTAVAPRCSRTATATPRRAQRNRWLNHSPRNGFRCGALVFPRPDAARAAYAARGSAR